MTYNPEPRYPLVGGEVDAGWEPLAVEVARPRPRVLARDGPAALRWERVEASLGSALQARTVDVRSAMAPWDEIQRRTAAGERAGDAGVARASRGSALS